MGVQKVIQHPFCHLIFIWDSCSKFSIRNHTTHFLNFYKKKAPKDENELFSNYSHDRNYE